jgi:hypothetical protein
LIADFLLAVFPADQDRVSLTERTPQERRVWRFSALVFNRTGPCAECSEQTIPEAHLAPLPSASTPQPVRYASAAPFGFLLMDETKVDKKREDFRRAMAALSMNYPPPDKTSRNRLTEQDLNNCH